MWVRFPPLGLATDRSETRTKGVFSDCLSETLAIERDVSGTNDYTPNAALDAIYQSIAEMAYGYGDGFMYLRKQPQ